MTDTTTTIAAPAAPTTTITETTTAKPGWQTTEFWLSTAAKLLGVLFASGVIGAGTTLERIAGLAAALLASLGYTVSRALVKAAGVLLVVGLAGSIALAPGCDTGRARAANGTAALLDCTADARATVIADLGVTLRAWVLKHVAGDGRTIDMAQLERDAQALKGEVIGSCALVTALAILATPAQAPAPQGLLAAPAGPTPEQWRVALVEVRAELGVGAVRAVP